MIVMHIYTTYTFTKKVNEHENLLDFEVYASDQQETRQRTWFKTSHKSVVTSAELWFPIYKPS